MVKLLELKKFVNFRQIDMREDRAVPMMGQSFFISKIGKISKKERLSKDDYRKQNSDLKV